MAKASATAANDTAPEVAMIDRRTFASKIVDKLMYSIGKDTFAAKPHDYLAATILALRDRIIDRWMESTREVYQTGGKRVYYLSLEFLIGRLMRDERPLMFFGAISGLVMLMALGLGAPVIAEYFGTGLVPPPQP